MRLLIAIAAALCLLSQVAHAQFMAHTVTSSLPLQVVANRGLNPDDGGFRVASSANVKRTYRTRHFLGVDTSCMVLAVTGFSPAGTIGNSQIVEAGIELTSPVQTVEFTWSGQTLGTIGSGQSIYTSDPLCASAFGLPFFPSQMQFWLRANYEVPSGGNIPEYYVTTAGCAVTGEGAIEMATGVASLVSSTGALPGSGGGYTATTDMRLPMAILGTPLHKQPAYLLQGDSITRAVGDSQGDPVMGCGGWWERALDSLPNHVPYASVAESGRTAQQYGTTTAAVLSNQSSAIWSYFRGGKFYDEYAGNDCASAESTSSIIGFLEAQYAVAVQLGFKYITQTTLPPRATSTDLWETLGNQTVEANFGSAQCRGQFNTAILAVVGTNNLNAVFDLNATLYAGPSNPDLWIVNGTANFQTVDGTHPSPTGNGLMATGFEPTLP